MSKAHIIGRIRSALGERRDTRVTDYSAIPRRYRQATELTREGRLDLFLSRIQHYEGGVFRCERAALRETIAHALSDRARQRLAVAPGFPRDWLPDGFDFVFDNNLTYTDLDRSDGALTTCTLAIAWTGTIALHHSPSEGRRALTLVPDYHLCIVDADQIVETVPEAIRRLRALTPSLVTTISGPSATTNIEITRVKGVHGPRTLDVVVVE